MGWPLKTHISKKKTLPPSLLQSVFSSVQNKTINIVRSEITNLKENRTGS